MILGTIFFENYYVVFDMTPAVGDSLATNQIGYGPINPRNVLGDSIYDSSDAHFDRALHDASTSFDYTLQYKAKPATDDPDDVKKIGDSLRTHKIVIGIILVSCVIAIVIGCCVYFNPDKCRSKRGASLAYDDAAIH